MEGLIADAAKREHAGLFHRFAIMQHWQSAQPEDAPKMIGPDGLHMSDRGYGCIAADLAEAVAANWRAHQATAAQAHAGRLARLPAAGAATVPGAPRRPPPP